MTHAQRQKLLATLGWHPERDQRTGDQLQSRIDGSRVWWISGEISGVRQEAWIRESDGFVFLQLDGAPEDRDFEFEAFIALVRDGWPVKLTKVQGRGFDFGDDE